MARKEKIKKEFRELLINLLTAVIIVVLLNLLYLAFGLEWSEKEFISNIFISFFAMVFARYASYYWINLLSDEKELKSISNSNQNTSFHKTTKKYFNSLVQKFIKDPENKNIYLEFRDDLSSEKGKNENKIVLGGFNRRIESFKYKILGSIFTWKPTKEPVYTIYFLKDYPDSFSWRQTIVHEFTHLYLCIKEPHEFLSKESKQVHDDNFYSHMDYFEDWFDKKWNLTPRQNKGDDWNQHINPARVKWRWQQYTNESFHWIPTKVEWKNFTKIDFPPLSPESYRELKAKKGTHEWKNKPPIFGEPKVYIKTNDYKDENERNKG